MQLKRFIGKIQDRNKFTLAKYEEFLQIISKYTVLPLNEFRNYHNDNEVVIGLRKDSDSNFRALENMAWTEEKHGIKSTFFILHTADYYKPDIFPSLLKMQSLGFEIGLHNDILSTKGSHGLRMRYELQRLKNRGLKIIGTSAHGRDKKLGLNNLTFWDNHRLQDFGFEYEAYSLDHNLYFSDCTFINGHRWHPLDIDWSEIKPGARIQILIHPEHHR